MRINPGELHILDHDFNMQHFKSKNLDKGRWYYQLARNALAGLHDHHEHKQRRSLLDPLFNGWTLTKFIPSIDEHVSTFRARLADAAQTLRPLNMSHLFWALMNDIVADHLLGCKLDGLLMEDLSLVAKTRSYSALHIVSYLRQWPLNFLFEVRHLPLIRMIVPLTGSEEVSHGASHKRYIVLTTSINSWSRSKPTLSSHHLSRLENQEIALLNGCIRNTLFTELDGALHLSVLNS